MTVSLYTARVILEVIGIEDYGIYSIVGGVVTIFSFFNLAMISATQRFLAFDIGRGDEEQLKNTFNATFIIHIGIAILIFLLAETVGLWFVNNILNVPVRRMDAVNWIYQFSVLTFLIGVIQVPFNALIIAREKMSAYALMSIVEVILKLLIVYILILFDFDKLKLYAVLVFVVALIIALCYSRYCRRHFNETELKWYYDKLYFNKLIAYSGWNLFGNIASVARGQGLNIVLNLVFGVMVNAAYGIMLQVQGAISVFVSNFQQAVNPQIIKSYATNDKGRTMRLIFKSSKFSFFLLLLITTPVIYNIDYVLEVWLKNPPVYSVTFVKLCLINMLIDCVSGPLMTGAQATGNIKWYQITVGLLVLLNLPVSYVLLLVKNDPNYIFYVSIFISLITFNFRLFFLKRELKMSFLLFYRIVVFRVVLVSCVVFFCLFLYDGRYYEEQNIITFCLESLIILLLTIFVIVTIGIDKNEKDILKYNASKIRKRWLNRI